MGHGNPGSRLACGALTLSLVASFSADAVPTPRLSIENPPPYGYHVGDTLQRTVLLEADTEFHIDAAHLPRPGPVSRGLELRRIDVRSDSKSRQRLILEYQIFLAPLVVKTLQIPALTVAMAGASEPLSVPAWTFSLSPLQGLAIGAGAGQEAMRPDAAPESPDPAPALYQAAGFSASGGLAMLWLGQLNGWLGWNGKGRHFRAARRALTTMASQGAGPEALRAAFSHVHRAFDLTLGEPLFADRLAQLMARGPAYRALQPEVEAFFQASARLFFESGEPPEDFDLARLDRLCQACIRAELQTHA